MQQQTDTSFTNSLFCAYSNRISLFCMNQTCLQPALLCRNEQCQCMPKFHRNCQFICAQALVCRILAKKTTITPQVEKGIAKIDQIYQTSIEKLSQYRQSLARWKENMGLSIQEINFLDLLKQSKIGQITGKIVNEINKNVETIDDISWLDQQTIEQFWENNEKYFEKSFEKLKQLVSIQSYKNRRQDFLIKKLCIDLNLSTQYATRYTQTKQLRNKKYIKSSDQGNWYQLCSKSPVPQCRLFQFQIDIQATKSGRIAIGLCTKPATQYRKAVGSVGNILYICNGEFNQKGAVIGGNQKILNGSTVQVKVDRKEGKIAWLVKNKQIKTANLQSLLQNENTQLFISISCIDVGDTFHIR